MGSELMERFQSTMNVVVAQVVVFAIFQKDHPLES